jgi:hypothetical protein
MARRPFVRASNARDSLDYIRANHPDLSRHLTEAVPAEVLSQLETSVRTDWIPVAIDSQYVDAVLRYLGPDGTKSLYQAFLVQSLVRSPLMSSLFHGVRRVFGVSVGAFLRVLPSGFGQSYKDAFDIQLERGEREALLVFDDIAPEVLRVRAAYPVIWEGIFLGVYELAGAEPRLEYRIGRAARRMEARFHW